jgi:hypothetical protein
MRYQSLHPSRYQLSRNSPRTSASFRGIDARTTSGNSR